MKFKAVLFAVLAVGAVSMSANAAKMYDFSVQKLVTNSGVSEATIRMTNLSKQFMPRLDVRCEFKDGKGKTVDIGWRRYLRLNIGKTEQFTVKAKTGTNAVRSVNCAAMWW